MSRLLGIILAAGALVLGVPLSTDAQNTGKTARIGALFVDPPPGAPGDPGFFAVFREGMRDLGYEQGRNLVIEARFADGNLDDLNAMAQELVRLKLEVLLTDSTIATTAAKRATTSIPIVFAIAVDPISAGIVSTLGHPGGNITGLASMLSELVGKRLELLHDTFPKVSRVAVIYNPRHPAHGPAMQEIDRAARALHMTVAYFPVQNPDEFERAFKRTRRWKAEALTVLDDAFLDYHRVEIARHAIDGRLPTIFGYRLFVEGGGLMSYGPDLPDMFRRSAKIVDRILNGAKPGDIPVEQPVKFALVINMKTMKALGITIPQPMLARADDIIR